jgi:hypothetical protein
MGLLDDAIREHLELKRQHGGDPSEIERQAREALGAPGRTTQPSGDGVGAVQATPDADAASAEAAPPTEDHVIGPGPEEAVDAPIERAAEPPPSEPPAPEPPAPAAEPPTEAGAPQQPAAEPAPRRERDWMAEDAPAEEESAPDEDVLEETPDFLQETPEHDRLWFEQKPPRDFDWDR